MATNYQIPIKPKHRENTAFSCHLGHFQFKMAFGLNNAPATERCIDVILKGCKETDWYI
jgi:hypothetical protein